MDLRAIELFLAVAEQGSFTKAAEKTFVTQPYLSKVVKQMEEELNVTLFNRTTRKLELTDAGKIVIEQGRMALKPLQDMPNLLNELQNLQKGEIILGIPPVIGTLIFPSIAQRFSHAFPDVTLRLIELGAKHILTLAEEEKIDVGFTVKPFSEGNFRVKPYFVDEFMIYLSHNHPLAHRERIKIAELADEKFIVFTTDFTLRDMVIKLCAKNGFKPNIAYESSQWDLMVELIAIDMGVAVLPKSIFEKHNNPHVKMIAIDSDEPYLWEIAMITKKERYLSYATRAFLDMF